MKKMNKTTIALSALAASLVSAQASALMIDNPDTVWKTKVTCLNSYGADGVKSVYEICDQSKNNELNKRPLLSNGCAKDQVAVNETINVTAGEKFKLKIKSCAVENDSDIEPTQL